MGTKYQYTSKPAYGHPFTVEEWCEEWVADGVTHFEAIQQLGDRILAGKIAKVTR